MGKDGQVKNEVGIGRDNPVERVIHQPQAPIALLRNRKEAAYSKEKTS